ncbi:MAG: response regulator [Acidobacteriia bacterium]|nr:response regulator [Terriglobia bacterium]
MQPGSPVSVLAILPSPEDRRSLRSIFQHSKWDLRVAENLQKARELLRRSLSGLVLSDSSLPDGDWQDVLAEVRRTPSEPPLVVCSRSADERLWAEVLNLGGYDVLATPFETQEVVRSVSQAWRHWRDTLFAGGAS